MQPQNNIERWIFDSGSSTHMTGDEKLLNNLIPVMGPSVMFGDHSRGSVVGIDLVIENTVALYDVSLVENWPMRPLSLPHK